MSTHENLSRQPDGQQQTSDRFFGLTFCVVFALFGLWPLLGGRSPSPVFLGIGLVFLSLALAAPALLAPLNRLWLKFGALLHGITSPIILGVMFFLVIMPIGLVMRLFGKDFLRLRFDREVPSYWIRREPPGPEKTSLDKQF